MLFTNPDFTKTVTVDLDCFFYYFVRPPSEWPEDEKQGITLDLIRQRYEHFFAFLPDSVPEDRVYAEYRRSSNDHVHVRIVFPGPVSVLDGFLIRAWFKDDQTRLELDLSRYLYTNGDLHEMNRCFDEKITSKGVKVSGPWIPLYVNRDQYIGDIKTDFQNYLSRWKDDPANPEYVPKDDQCNLGFL